MEKSDVFSVKQSIQTKEIQSLNSAIYLKSSQKGVVEYALCKSGLDQESSWTTRFIFLLFFGMLYFKTLTIPNASQQTETAIRAGSLKRHTSLDFNSGSSWIREDQYFLGQESDTALRLTRLRTSFERLLPKIIIRFNKDSSFSTYQVRYGLFSTLALCILVLNLMQSLVEAVSRQDYLDITTAFGWLLMFLILTLVEITLTQRQIKKALKKYTPLGASIDTQSP